MNRRILIIEDEFIVADDLQLTLEQAKYKVCGIAGSAEEAREIIEAERPGLVLLDIHLKGNENGIQLGHELREKNIAFIYVSANSNWKVFEQAKSTQPYGFLIKPFREKDLFITIEVAFYLHANTFDAKWKREEQLRDELYRIACGKHSWHQKLVSLAATLQKYIAFDGLTGKFKKNTDQHRRGFGLHRKAFDMYEFVGLTELSAATNLPLSEICYLLDESPDEEIMKVHNSEKFKEMLKTNPLKAVAAKAFNFSSSLTFPILGYYDYEFSITFFSIEPEGYHTGQIEWISELEKPIAAVLASVTEDQDSKQNSAGPDRLRIENSVSKRVFLDLIGNSSSFLHVMDLVARIAPLETSVLLFGEAGTGKDRIANCICRLSKRENKPFLKVNCTGHSSSVLLRQLFGQEYTEPGGASGTLPGIFELASGGTIYLDEIDAMPPDVQHKLLLLLQEKTITRVGGKVNIAVDVRIIASASPRLEANLAEGRFRLDLYYRLSVFTVELPPLRDRKGDIKAFTNYFAGLYAANMNMQVPVISAEMFRQLQQYHWPGNIIELENIISAAILRCQGKKEIYFDLPPGL